MTISSNQIIQFMMTNHIDEIVTRLNQESPFITLDPLDDATKASLASHGYVIDETKANDGLLLALTYRWHQAQVECEKRVGVLLAVLDAYYHISPNAYFNQLLEIGNETQSELKRWSNNRFPYGMVTKHVPALENLAIALQFRIREKEYPKKVLLAYINDQNNGRSLVTSYESLPGYKKSKHGQASVGACILPSEIEAIKSAQKDKITRVTEGVTHLLDQLHLQNESTTLFSAIVQLSIYSEAYANRLGYSALEISYQLLNQKGVDSRRFYPVMGESRLMSYLYHDEPFTKNYFLNSISTYRYQINHANLKAVTENEPTELEIRFKILKCYFSDQPESKAYEACKHKLYDAYTSGAALQYREGYAFDLTAMRTFVYPAWLISTMLKFFEIDINAPLNDGEAPILTWFKEKEVNVFKHLLDVETVTPSDENVSAIMSYIEGEIVSETMTDTRRKALHDSALVLSGAPLDGRPIQDEFKEKMMDIGLFQRPAPKVEPVIEPVVTPLASQTQSEPPVVHAYSQAAARTSTSSAGTPLQSQTDENRITPIKNPAIEISYCALDPGQSTNNFARQAYFDEHCEALYLAPHSDEDITALINTLKDSVEEDDLDKHQFAHLKKAINTYFISKDETKAAIKTIIDNHSDNLDEAAKQNYLLYVLALGRTNFKLHTQKGLFGKQNHFTALNDFLHGQPLDESTLKKFGLFQAPDASGEAGQVERKKPQRKPL